MIEDEKSLLVLGKLGVVYLNLRECDDLVGSCIKRISAKCLNLKEVGKLERLSNDALVSLKRLSELMEKCKVG